MTGANTAVMDGLVCNANFVATTQRLARIGVPVKLRKVARSNIHPDSVTGLEDIGSASQFNFKFIDFVGSKQVDLVQTISEFCPQDAFRNGIGTSVWIDVHQLNHPISIRSIGCGM